MNNFKLVTDTGTGGPAAEFRFVVESLSAMLEREGLVRKPYVRPELPYFTQLNSDLQQLVLANVSCYYQVLADAERDGASLRDTPVLLWKMLKRLGLTPTDDLFSYITGDQIVEIYNCENIQVFRNFRFFEICSYSLEELFCRQWWELFRRDDEITRRIFGVGMGLLKGDIEGTVVPELVKHELEEISSPLCFRMNVDIHCLSPLYQQDKVMGVCAVERAELLNEPKKDLDRVRYQLENYYEGLNQ